MTIKSDHWIRRKALEDKMIDPFVEGSIRSGVISYGISSYGYDIRVSNEFKIFTNINSSMVDPKNFDEHSFVERRSDICIIPPTLYHHSLITTIFYLVRQTWDSVFLSISLMEEYSSLESIGL